MNTFIIAVSMGFTALILLVIFLLDLARRLDRSRRTLTAEVAEQRRTEDALRESEARFRSYFELPHVGIAITSPAKCWLEANAAACAMLGYSAQELAGLNWAELTHPDDLAADVLQFNRVLAGEIDTYTLEKRFIRKSGDAVWTNLTVGCVRKPDRSVDYTVALLQDITERKRAEAVLHESETNLSSLIENIDGSIWAVDKNYGLIVGNEEFQRNVSAALGRRLEIAESVLLPSFPPEASAEWRGYYDRALQGETFSVETVTRFRETPHDIEYRFSPIREAGAAIRGVTIFGRDITARKQAEETLRENASLLRAMAENYPNSYISIIEQDLTVGYTAGQEFKKLNLDPNQFVGLTLEQVFGEHTPLVRENYLKTFDGVETHFELFINDQHQSYRTVPLIDSTGRIHRILAVVEDITDRMQAVETLKQSLQRFKALLSQAPSTGVIYRLIHDNDGNITDWEISDINAQGAASIGLTMEAAIGKRALTLFGERVMAPYFEVARQVVASGQPRMFETYFEANDRHYLTSVFMVDSEHYANMGVDITDRKRAEAEVRHLNAELEQRVLARTAQLEAINRELEAFSYSAAHDLRAPLRGIDGWSMALLEDYGPQLDAQAHDYLNRVRSEAQHMAQLIDALQQLARITRTELRPSTVDLSALARISAARLQAAQPERQFDFDIQAGLLARGDADLLEIALTNLLANAAKFTGPRAVARIEFGLTQVNDRPAYFVRDNGVGFDVMHAQNLFGAFQRLHRATEFPGTGVGLATVRRILVRHGGQIWAEAAVDQGATFYFTLA